MDETASKMDAKDYFESDKLRDGSEIIVRSIRPDDKQGLQEGLSRLSEDSIYMRFFRVIRKLSERELKNLTEIDFVNHVALGVALVTDGEPLPIGVGRYVVNGPIGNPNSAEVALAVDEDYQGIGVGSALLRHLMRIATARAIIQLEFFVLPTNRRMLRVLAATGLPLRQEQEDGVIRVQLSIEDSTG